MLGRIVPLLIPSLLLVAMSYMASPGQAQTFEPTVNVSNTSANSGMTGVAVAGSNVYVAWVDDRGSGVPLFSRSSDSGGTFSPGLQVFSGFFSRSGGPMVAAAGTNVYIAQSARSSKKQPNQVYFRRSTNGGTTFGSQIQVSTASFDGASLEAIGASGSNVYLVWRQSVSPSTAALFLARSIDNGEHFGTPVAISATAGSNVNVVADGSNLHIAWAEYFGGGPTLTASVFYTRSIDSGATFSGILNVSNNVVAINVGPVLAATGSSVYIAWRAGASSDTTRYMYFARSSNTGGSFSPPADLSGPVSDTGNIADGPYPRIAASGSDVHVIWHENPAGRYDVFYRGSDDNGASFRSAINVSNPNGASAYSPVPVIAAGGTHVYIHWRGDVSAGRAIYVAHSPDSGVTFPPGALWFVNSLPSMIVSPTEVHVFWADSSLGNAEVFYRHGTFGP